MIEELKAFPVVVSEAVRWGDMDAFEHVNNTVYFRYFESARIAYFARVGFGRDGSDNPVGPILADTSCRFRRPLEYPDQLQIGVRVTGLSSDRFTMEFVVWSDALKTVAATGTGTIVSYDYVKKGKAPLPEKVRAAILALEPNPG